MDYPLSGVRVLELGNYIAAPQCGMILADLGAEVIKIEPPEGEQSRHTAPGKINGETPYYYSLNRNKKSMVIDLKIAQGKEVFLGLVKKSDAVINNFRSGVMDKLGLGEETLKHYNPEIINVSISAFGKDGPYSERPGFDHVIQGLSGIAYMNADPESPPRVISLSIIDIIGGLYSTIGLLAALFRRTNDSKGSEVDISLLDCAISLLSYHVANYFAFGEEPKRVKGGAHPYSTPAQVFKTKDSFISIFTFNDKFWGLLCEAIDRPEWSTDKRFKDATLRYQNREKLIQMLQLRLEEKTTKEWMDAFVKVNIPAAPVNSFAEALEDPQVKHRGMIVDYEHITCGSVKVLGNPIRLTDSHLTFKSAPTLGQHTEQILREILLFDEMHIKELKQNAVVN